MLYRLKTFKFQGCPFSNNVLPRKIYLMKSRLGIQRAGISSSTSLFLILRLIKKAHTI